MEKTMKVKIMAPTTLIVEGRPVSLNLFSEDEIKQYCKELEADMLVKRADMLARIEAAKPKAE